MASQWSPATSGADFDLHHAGPANTVSWLCARARYARIDLIGMLASCRLEKELARQTFLTEEKTAEAEVLSDAVLKASDVQSDLKKELMEKDARHAERVAAMEERAIAREEVRWFFTLLPRAMK